MDDRQAISDLIERQFASLSWAHGTGPDAEGFMEDFHPDALLFASARPARAQTPRKFLERMEGLSQTSLRAFAEHCPAREIRIFGNVAVAVAACESVENNRERSRNVEMMLLVKDSSGWKIAAQAWDKMTPGQSFPDWLS